MSRTKPNQFVLEALEARVLLSADIIASGVVSEGYSRGAVDGSNISVELHPGESIENRDGLSDLFASFSSPSSQPGSNDFLFDGMAGELLLPEGKDLSGRVDSNNAKSENLLQESSGAGEANSTSISEEVGATGATVAEDPNGSGTLVNLAVDQVNADESLGLVHAVSEPDSASPGGAVSDPSLEPVEQIQDSLPASVQVAAANETSSIDDSKTVVFGPTFENSSTQQLTKTLRAANGPPDLSANGQSVTSNSYSTPLVATSGTSPIHLTPQQPLAASNSLIIAPSQTLSGNGVVHGNVVSGGLLSPGNSPGYIEYNGDLTLGRGGRLLIEIGGNTAATLPELTSPLDRYDNLAVNGTLHLGGTLEVTLTEPDPINNPGVLYTPSVGEQFDIIVFEDGYDGSFDNYEGLVFASGLFFKPSVTFTSGSQGKVTLTVLGAASAQVRPVVFIPGFGGSFAADTSDAGLQEWFLHRGLGPDKLVLEPLILVRVQDETNNPRPSTDAPYSISI